MKRYFLGAGNTCKLFKNYFDNILYGDDGFEYILKGGPGTGKSSFMKKVGEYFENRGFQVEYFFCSSDIDSLDGIRIVEKNICIVDGTAPHVTEASIPGVKEKIINLGMFINDNIVKNKNEITSKLISKNKCFKLGYSYLTAIDELIQVERLIQEVDIKTVIKKSNKILAKININSLEKGVERKLFISYLAINGIQSLYEKNSFKKIIQLNCKNMFEGEQILEEIRKTLIQNNIYFVSFLSLLDPTKVESILIPSINLVVENNNKNFIFENQQMLDELILKAGESINNAKYYHKQIEEFYITNMDFDGINKLRTNIIKEIENR